MKKCIMCLLVASLLCATVLTGCVDASLSGSLPSTAPGTTGTEAANPTQTKPKPTETQPNPTQTVPANPLKPRPGLVNYTSYEVLDMGKYWSIENQGCLGDAYVLSSVEECVRIVVDASDDSH